MTKLGIFTSLTALVTAIVLATVSPSASAGDPAPSGDPAPCVHKDLKTDLVKNACTSGGQPAAKDAMKKFMKEAKIKSCNLCHSKLAPTYTLNEKAYDEFKKAGGK